MTVCREFEDTRPIGVRSDNCHGLRGVKLAAVQVHFVCLEWSLEQAILLTVSRLPLQETSHFASEGSLGGSEHVCSMNDEKIRCWQQTGS